MLFRCHDSDPANVPVEHKHVVTACVASYKVSVPVEQKQQETLKMSHDSETANVPVEHSHVVTACVASSTQASVPVEQEQRKYCDVMEQKKPVTLRRQASRKGQAVTKSSNRQIQ